MSDNINEELTTLLINEKQNIINLYEEREYSKLIRLIMDLADDVNKYINEQTHGKRFK